MNVKLILSIGLAALSVASLIDSAHADDPHQQPDTVTYKIVYPNGKPAADATVTVIRATDATGIRLRHYHGGLITGKVNDRTSGAPAQGVLVTAVPADGNFPEVRRDIRSAVTGQDGAYYLRISPGAATVMVQSTSKIAESLPKTYIRIHEGEAKTVNFRIDASNYPTVYFPVTAHRLGAYANSEIGTSVTILPGISSGPIQITPAPRPHAPTDAHVIRSPINVNAAHPRGRRRHR